MTDIQSLACFRLSVRGDERGLVEKEGHLVKPATQHRDRKSSSIKAISQYTTDFSFC